MVSKCIAGRPWICWASPERPVEENKYTKIAPELSSSSRRAKGSVFIIRDFWRNNEDGRKNKQDGGFIFFHRP
jgi:hypothetical protein